MTKMFERGRAGRLAAAASAAVVVLAAFAVLGGVGLAKSTIALAQYQYGKVTICHKGRTITVSVHAWPAHQRHGDTLGKCPTGQTKPGKRKGSSHHAPNPGSDAGASTGSSPSTGTTTHGNGKGNGGGHGKGNGGSNGTADGQGNGNGGGQGNGGGHGKGH